MPRSPGSVRSVATARATSLRSGLADDGRVLIVGSQGDVAVDARFLDDYASVSLLCPNRSLEHEETRLVAPPAVEPGSLERAN